TNSPSTTGYRAKSNPPQGAFAKGSTPSTSNNVRNSCVSWSSKFASPDQTCRFTCAFHWMSPPPRRTPQPTRAPPSQPAEPSLINRFCVHLVEFVSKVESPAGLSPQGSSPWTSRVLSSSALDTEPASAG